MRETIKSLVSETIIFECSLPNEEHNLSGSIISNCKDMCYNKKSDISIAKIIYNNIVEFSMNEYDIDYENLNREQLRVLGNYLRYNEEATDTTKLKYGFYGEVLLYSILYTKFRSDVLISKGYFYSPLEQSEAKGYDAFHIVQKNNKLELWFGEAKFYINFQKPIKDVLANLKKTLSDDYLNNNLIAIFKEKHNISNGSEVIEELERCWKENPKINLAEQIRLRNMILVYPIFIAFGKKNDKSYHENILECLEYAERIAKENNINLNNDLNIKLFFVFLPVDNVKTIKKAVIEWISLKEPLI